MKPTKKLGRLFMLLTGASLMATSVSQAAIDVTLTTNSVADFNRAIRNANSMGGGTITIDIPRGQPARFLFSSAPPAYNGGGNRLRIRAVRRVEFNAQDRSNILQVSGRNNRLVVSGIRFRNGNTSPGSPGQGGAIGTLETETNNFIVARNCRFVDCRSSRGVAGSGGGGIRCRIGNRLQVTGNVFVRCSAPTGGGIAVTGSNTVIRDSRFIECESFGAPDGGNIGPPLFNANGAAVRIDSPSSNNPAPIDVIGCTFQGNIRGASITRGGVALNIFSSATPPRNQTFFARVNRNQFIENVGEGPTVRIFVTRSIGRLDALFRNNTFTRNDTERNTSNANVNLIN